jgi:hypothetical protein
MDAKVKQCIQDLDGDPEGKCVGHDPLPLVRVAQPVVETILVPTTVYVNMPTSTVNMPTTVMTTMSTIVTTTVPTTVYQTITPDTTATIPAAPTSSSHSECTDGCPALADKLTPPGTLIPYLIVMVVLMSPFAVWLFVLQTHLGKIRQEVAQLESLHPPAYSVHTYQTDGIDVEKGCST